MARVIAVLALDVVLLTVGVVFIFSYLDAREHVRAESRGAGNAVADSSRAAASSVAPEDAETALQRDVSAVVDRHRPDIQRCYAKVSEQAASPPDGRLDIQFTVEPDGRVSQVAAVVDETGSAPLTQCVSQLFESWTFSARPGGSSTELVWPLRFKAPR